MTTPFISRSAYTIGHTSLLPLLFDKRPISSGAMLTVGGGPGTMSDSSETSGLHPKAWPTFIDIPSGGLGHASMLHHSPHASLRASVPGYPSSGVSSMHGHLVDMAYGVTSSTASPAPFPTSASGVGYPYSMTSRSGYGLPSPTRNGTVTSCGGQPLSFDSYYHMSSAGAAGLHLASAAAAAVRSGVYIVITELKHTP